MSSLSCQCIEYSSINSLHGCRLQAEARCFTSFASHVSFALICLHKRKPSCQTKTYRLDARAQESTDAQAQSQRCMHMPQKRFATPQEERTILASVLMDSSALLPAHEGSPLTPCSSFFPWTCEGGIASSIFEVEFACDDAGLQV